MDMALFALAFGQQPALTLMSCTGMSSWKKGEEGFFADPSVSAHFADFRI